MRASATEAGPGAVASLQKRESEFKLLRFCCWCVAVALGAADAWAARFTMFPDGVSYLDVGDAFWHGDWHNAINTYWSPLYPWLLGFVLKICKPSAYWEYPLVHLVNFLLYLAALACFEFFLGTFIEQQRGRDRDVALPSDIGLPLWAWYVAGYSTFVSASLLLITVRFPSGDMIVAAIVYLASALVLKVRAARATWATFACLGCVLGIGYLAKAVMFLMSVPFLAVTAAAHWVAVRKRADTAPDNNGAGADRLACKPVKKTRFKTLKPVALSVLFFVLIAFPFVFLLSAKTGRPTFGDSGKINYEISVNMVQFFIPQEKSARHPVKRLAILPDAFEYADPISGTYPLWFDPTYWHEGIEPHFALVKQLRMLGLSALTCAWISFNLFLGLSITIPLFVLYLASLNIPHCLRNARLHWELWVPAASGIALYSLVVIEPRYVAAYFCLLWLVALSGVRLPPSRTSRQLLAGVVLAMATTVCLISAWQTSRALTGIGIADQHIATPICWRLAEALHSRGITSGSKIAVVGTWLVPDQEASYVARLARVRIVAEARPEGFWAADPAARSRFDAELMRLGAKAILSYQPPRIEQGWERLLGTDYYLYRLTSSTD